MPNCYYCGLLVAPDVQWCPRCRNVVGPPTFAPQASTHAPPVPLPQPLAPFAAPPPPFAPSLPPPPHHQLTMVRMGRSPGLALILSLLLPGLGQVYNRDTIKGAFLLSLSLYLIVLAAVWLATRFLRYQYGIIMVPPFALVWIYGMYDAYVRARTGVPAPATGPRLA